MDTFGRLSITAAALMVFSAIFIVVCFICLVWPWYREQRRPRRLVSIHAELDALDALDPPTVRPGALFDHSEAVAAGLPTNTCVECYIEWLQDDTIEHPVTSDGKMAIYVIPEGKPMVCPKHLAGRGRLARALERKETAR